MTPEQALTIVREGRAYTREHFSVPRQGYVGHHTAVAYDEAIDTLVSFVTEVRVIAYAGDCDACGVPDRLMDLFHGQNGDDTPTERSA